MRVRKTRLEVSENWLSMFLTASNLGGSTQNFGAQIDRFWTKNIFFSSQNLILSETSDQMSKDPSRIGENRPKIEDFWWKSVKMTSTYTLNHVFKGSFSCRIRLWHLRVVLLSRLKLFAPFWSKNAKNMRTYRDFGTKSASKPQKARSIAQTLSKWCSLG